MSDLVVRAIETAIHGRYLMRVPVTAPPFPLLVGFHGYGESAEAHLEQLEQIPGAENWLLVAIQGLHRFYMSKMQAVVASWMTRQDREQAIADNLAYVQRVLAVVRREHVTHRLAFAGFSQGVAMAYRAATEDTRDVQAIVALAGDVPPDVRERAPRPFPRVLVGRGARDSYYTEDKMNADLAWLRGVGAEVQTAVHDAGHEWTDAFRAAAGVFLQAAFERGETR